MAEYGEAVASVEQLGYGAPLYDEVTLISIIVSWMPAIETTSKEHSQRYNFPPTDYLSVPN